MSPIINSPLDDWDKLSDRELIAQGMFEGNTPAQGFSGPTAGGPLLGAY